MTALRRALVVAGGLLAIGVVAAAVLAYLTFGVGGGAGGSAPSGSPAPAADAVASSRASAQAPASFRDRPVFRSCGISTLPPGGAIPPARIACLSATPDEGRELVVVTSTTEGDPVVRYFRTGPDLDGVEVFEDATADRFGGGWHHSFCRSGLIDQTGACA
jgi:hypothetical protein